MSPAKTADTEKVPIEKIDSATRASEPLEKDVATRDAMTRAAGANPGLPFLPPGDTPGIAPNTTAPTPPPYDNTYAFTVYLKANPAMAVYLGQAANPLGDPVRIVAPNWQAAYQALLAQYGANLLKVTGPCPVFVGADHGMSQAAGASSPMQAHPLHSDTAKSDSSKSDTPKSKPQPPEPTPRKSHSSWD